MATRTRFRNPKWKKDKVKNTHNLERKGNEYKDATYERWEKSEKTDRGKLCSGTRRTILGEQKETF